MGLRTVFILVMDVTTNNLNIMMLMRTLVTDGINIIFAEKLEGN